MSHDERNGKSEMERSNGMRLVRTSATGHKAVAQSGLAGWLLTVLRGGRCLARPDEARMKLLETLPLGGKKQLMLVSCDGERFLVGGSIESVSTIVPVRCTDSQAAGKDVDDPCR